jgi:hypothetical protein
MTNFVRGNKLYLQIGTGNTNLKGQTTSASLEYEDAEGGLLTFEEAEKGGSVQPFMNISLAQSTDPDSLFMKFWDAPGAVYAFTFAPHGNSAPTNAQPHFLGHLKVPHLRPTLGGEAVTDGPGYTSEVRCDVVTATGEKPGTITKDTGASK